MFVKLKFSRKNTTILLLVMIAIISCKRKEETTTYPLNIDFYIRYMSDGNQFNSLCKISYADSLALGESDTTSYNITIGNKDMKQIIAPNGRKHYNLQTQMPFKESYQINIGDPAGVIISQNTYLPYIDSLRPDKTISITKGGSLKWFGKPLTDAESIIVMIVSDDGKSTSFTNNGPSTSNQLIIKAESLTGLKPGKADLYLVRTFNHDITKDLKNYYFRNEFFSKTYKVEVSK